MERTYTLLDAGAEDFVALTTFRRSGVPVPTTVWVAVDGDALVVTTPPESGKVKRLRHTPDVELRPSTRRGSVDDDAPVARGRATLSDAPADVEAAHRLLGAKYGWQFRVAMLVERVIRRGSIRRVIVRITPEDQPPSR